MLVLKALILGIVEGFTEFLPISSTGHLIIAGEFVHYPQAKAPTFEIFIQLGAILAVFWHYRRELTDLVRRMPSDARARDLGLKVMLAFLPAAAIGLLFHHLIEEYLFNSISVAAALIAGGLLILLIESRARVPAVEDLEAVRWSDALWVGIAQVTALFPGVSRAGSTIIGGLLVGLSRPVATQFSFYLALPTLTAASLFSLIKSLPMLEVSDAAPLAMGFVAAFVSALVVIRGFIIYVQSHDFRIFGYYRIVFGVIVYAIARSV